MPLFRKKEWEGRLGVSKSEDLPLQTNQGFRDKGLG